MGKPSKLAILLIHLLALFIKISNSAKTILVDGVSEWKETTVVAGDTIIFRHRYNCSLYIFRNERAYQLCNFTEAAMLTKPNSTSFTWHPSRPGLYYFSFSNGSAQPCFQHQKLTVRVTLTLPPPLSENPSPAPTPDGTVPSSPAFPWPFRPREAQSPMSAAAPLATIGASPAPEDGADDGGVPFISSNPAVTLPKGAVDTATIRPVSTSSRHTGSTPQVVGRSAVYKVLCCVLFMMLL